MRTEAKTLPRVFSSDATKKSLPRSKSPKQLMTSTPFVVRMRRMARKASHLFTREAFRAMRRILTTNGVLVINCFGDFDRGKDFFVASLEKTLGSVFASVRIHNEHNGGDVLFFGLPPAHLNPPPTPDLARAEAGGRRRAGNPFHPSLVVDTHPRILLPPQFNPTP